MDGYGKYLETFRALWSGLYVYAYCYSPFRTRQDALRPCLSAWFFHRQVYPKNLCGTEKAAVHEKEGVSLGFVERYDGYFCRLDGLGDTKRRLHIRQYDSCFYGSCYGTGVSVRGTVYTPLLVCYLSNGIYHRKHSRLAAKETLLAIPRSSGSSLIVRYGLYAGSIPFKRRYLAEPQVRACREVLHNFARPL